MINLSSELGNQLRVNEYVNLSADELRKYRILLLVGALGWLLFGEVYKEAHEGFRDPFIIRLSISITVVLAVIVFSVFKDLNRYFLGFIYTFFYVGSAHIQLLLYWNGLPNDLLMSFVNILVVTSIFFKRPRPLYWYLGANLGALLVVCLLVTNPADALLKFTSVLTLAVAALVFLNMKFKTYSELQQKSDLLRTLFNESHDAVIIAELPSEEIVRCNPKALDLFRAQRRGDILGKRLDDLLGMCYHPQKLVKLKSVLRSEGVWKEETEFKTMTTGTFWGDMAIKHIQVGNVYNLYIRISDVSDRVMREMEIANTELKYRVLMEEASDGIYVCDREGNIIEANSKACELLGYQPEEFTGLNVSSIISAEDQLLGQLRQQELEEHSALIFERDYIKKDGSTITMEVSAKVINAQYYQAILRDVTARKRYEASLKRSENKFRALIEKSYDIVLIIDADFHISYVSPSVERIMSKKGEQFIDRNIFEFLRDDYRLMITRTLNKTAKEYGSFSDLGEISVIRDDGKEIFFDAVITNQLDDEIIDGLVINLHDITDRKQTEQKLLKANFELDSFVYKSSHDLRAPLLSILGLLNLALDTKDSSTMQQYLSMMKSSVLKLDKFITDLTHFSRNDRVEIKNEPIDFSALIDECLENLRYMKNMEVIDFQVSVEMRQPFANDPMRIGIILNNLITNAIKYHDMRKEQPYIRIMIESDNAGCSIKVADNGIGIDAHYRDKVFEMFYRATELSEGSGLGLYIVKNAVAKLDGSISVRSEVRQYTSFDVFLPHRFLPGSAGNVGNQGEAPDSLVASTVAE